MLREKKKKKGRWEEQGSSVGVSGVLWASYDMRFLLTTAVSAGVLSVVPAAALVLSIVLTADTSGAVHLRTNTASPGRCTALSVDNPRKYRHAVNL